MMKKARPWLVFLLIVLVAAAAGYYYYTAVYLPAQTPAEPAVQTTRVRTGDLVISVFGVGELAPQAQASASFRSSGVVAEVYAAVGDAVEAGQMLARLEDTSAQQQLAQSQLALQELFSPAALLQADMAALSAEVAYEKALGDLQTLISPTVWQAEQDLACQSVRNANLALENTLLLAPLSGVLTSFNLVPGQISGSGPAASVATLDQLAFKVYVEEADLPALRVGQRVVVTFNAYPDRAFGGQVQSIEPAPQDEARVTLDTTYENALSERNQLALGILLLQGSANAVTLEQAETMLPLWQLLLNRWYNESCVN